MNRLEAALRQIANDLHRHKRRWALVGGFAVSARTVPRFTRDVDVVVMVADDDSAEDLVRTLMSEGYSFFASVEHDNGRLATVRLLRAIDGIDVTVDLLFASSGIEPEIANTAEDLEVVPGLSLPVAKTGHLLALKLLARNDESRPQDLADLRELVKVADSADLKMARSAIDLITKRGFNRNRDLETALNQLTSRRGSGS